MKFRALLVNMGICIFAFFSLWGTTGAAGFPERPIQALVGWPVGTPNDLMDRAIVTPLARILKQPVIVQNIPGGGGGLVLGRVKTERPDGYALFQTGLPMFTQIPVMRPAPFNPLTDFAYLAQHARFEQYLLGRSNSPWKTFEELLHYIKKNPKTIRYGSGGTGSSGHIMMEYLGMKENLQWIHVPFNSVVEACTSLLGGHIDLAAMTLAAEVEYIKTGRLRPLICFNDKRMQMLPDVPTVLEKGYDFTLNGSYIWAVPVNTPKDIQKILEKSLLQAMADPEVKELIINKLNKAYDPVGSAETTRAVFRDHEKFSELMKKLGLGIYKK